MIEIVKNKRQIFKRFFLTFVAILFAILATPNVSPTSSQSIAQSPPSNINNPTNVVIDWNDTIAKVTRAAGLDGTLQFRAFAIAHAAIFDAANAVERRYTPYAVDITAPSGTAIDAAVASAGYTALKSLLPEQQKALDAALTTSLAKIPEGQSKIDGINIGQQVAEKIFAIRDQDGWNAKVDYQPGTGAGVWQPTPPAYAPAISPQIAKVTPFTFDNLNQFKIKPPLDVKSAAYIKDLKEVKSVGGKNSRVRTADQTAAAIFWTTSTSLIWNAAARAAATENRISTIDSARLFALLNFTGTDGYIAGYGIKYKYSFWRPVTAIRNANLIGNSAISADPNWESLIITPAHPDYVSGHCISSSAPERILQKFFGKDQVNLSFTFPLGSGVTRYYTSFSQLADEVGEARIWGGVHTRTADVQGREIGHQIADHAFASLLKTTN